MGVFNYNLEVVVPRVNLRKIPIQDPKDLKVEIEFPKGKLTFTSSQLNLLNFCGEGGISFEADSETIKDELTNGPLKVTVKLKDVVVGTGEIPWPKKFVDGMSENMEVFTEGANTELKMDDKVVGCLEVILRLQGCCNYCKIDEENENENEEEQANELNPGDIMFMMDDGEGCKKKEPEPEEDPCKGRLNLTNYKDSNGKVVMSPEFHSACTSPQCIGLKKMGGHLEKVVKSLVCAGLQDVRAYKKEKCCNPCDIKLDPCTGQFVCPPPDPTCCGGCGQKGALPLSKGEVACSIKKEIIKILDQVFEDSD